MALASPLQRAKRAEAAITHAVCPDATYSSHAIHAATKAGEKLAAEGIFVGPAYGVHFPTPWSNVDNLEITVPGSYYQFPILADGTIYNGDGPEGGDYVIFTADDGELAAVIYATPPGDQTAGYALCGGA